MNRTPLNLPRTVGLLWLGIAGLVMPRAAPATVIYSNPGPFVHPWMNPVGMPYLPSPAEVPGKEYSHDYDSGTGGMSGMPPPVDAEQIVAWDGLGGAANWLDYTGTRDDYMGDDDVDALANWYDSMFSTLMDDRAHFIFSIDDTLTLYDEEDTPDLGAHVPAAGPVLLSNGFSIGGAGELSYETPGGFGVSSSQGVWASCAQINSDPEPVDIDSIELWGPESPLTKNERNKYSLDVDYASYDSALEDDAVAVWNYDGTPFLAHSSIVEAVEGLLGTLEDAGLDDPALINIDAMMLLATNGSFGAFDGGAASQDMILFSIRQIANSDDESGYYATGSEIFWLDASGASGFFFHGGHAWDKDYALESLVYSTEAGDGVVDINALEAVGAVPEPSGVVTFCLLLAIASWWARRSLRHG